MRAHTLLSAVLLSLSASFLAGCGGSGGATTALPGNTNPQVTPAVTTPTPTPVTFDTAEYRRSNGLDNINALAAYEDGATGEDVIIGIVDSGIDVNNPEFAGRIHPASTNTAGAPDDIQDIDGHGTFVASVAAGAKNDVGTHGVAFEAQILALRSDAAGTCTSGDGCSHFDSDIAAALDVARAEGAQVSNLSLGGGGANFILRQAVDRATSDGMILVISSGNQGAAQPDDFALLALDERANGRVLISGYVDDNNVIDEFSNRAGSAQDVFVVAPGSGIRAAGLDGDEFFVSGSSFSAPHVSGAIALLYDLFPNLTPDQMIELVTSTATDLGAPGVDAVYGHGLINLEEAIQPQGSMQTLVTSASDQSTALAPLVSAPAAPSAFGGAIAAGLGGAQAVGFDRFDRAYDIPLAQFAEAAKPAMALTGLLNTRQRFAHSTLQDSTGTLTARFAVQQDVPLAPELLKSFGGAFADQADQQTVSAFMALDLGRTQIATYVNQRPGTGLMKAPEWQLTSLTDTDRTQHGIGSAPAQVRVDAQYALNSGWNVGFVAAQDAQDFDEFGIGLAGESSMTQSAMNLTWQGDGVALRTSVGAVRERGQIFGTQAQRGALSLGDGATTRYASFAVQANLGDAWRFDGEASYGIARFDTAQLQSLLTPTGTTDVTSWSAQLSRRGLVKETDAFALTLRQPQRVEAGTAALANLQGVTAAGQAFSLSPDGRQIDMEAAYAITLSGYATLSANMVMRRDAGHIAGETDMAALLRLTSDF
ncbi:MAG: S8 family peptidase [Pseudomonadota bacterium]